MQEQWDNKLLSSFMLFLDHTLLSSGAAFTNTSGSLYRVSGNISGINVFATPFKQLVNDSSISGASILSGVWVGATFLLPGQSGLHSINITEGHAYFTGNPSSVSGNYAVKDFSLYLTTRPEEEILFETKFYLRSEVSQTLTGLPKDSETYPVIYIKPIRSENIPFCLGGVDNAEAIFRVIVLSNSQFLTDAACSILKTMARKKFKVVEKTNIPLNAYGAMTGVNFNYNSVAATSSVESLIWKVEVSNLVHSRDLNKLNPQVFPAFVDFKIWSILG